MRKPQHLIPIIVLWKFLWDDFRSLLRPQFDPETEDLRGRVVDSDVGIPAAIEIAEGEAEFSRVLPVEQPSPTRIAVPFPFGRRDGVLLPSGRPNPVHLESIFTPKPRSYESFHSPPRTVFATPTSHRVRHRIDSSARSRTDRHISDDLADNPRMVAIS